jgi:hypothetical protein
MTLFKGIVGAIIGNAIFWAFLLWYIEVFT